ncbi:hypothetical protein TBK1r_39180 [Stieleria magnilauensis]|uniref:Uncharacterized protein n=1 Tax=Stieleria magnilauensis TaxID=2527963 RepID=A0ABX5XUK7_9BACT|nr:hypothetical protein TBK1r_39180 [Planctomycetes bacterium TBK1r]
MYCRKSVRVKNLLRTSSKINEGMFLVLIVPGLDSTTIAPKLGWSI